MTDFKWAARAPAKIKITGPKGLDRVDLERMSMKELRDWCVEADGVLNDMRCEVADYLAMRTERQTKMVKAFQTKMVEETNVKEAAKARKTAGVPDENLLTAVRMILQLKVQCGMLTADEVANSETAIANGGLDVIAMRLGIGFKPGGGK